MESSQEFSARAWRLFRQAQRLSERLTEDDAAYIHWMSVSSSRDMNWILGVALSIEQMTAELAKASSKLEAVNMAADPA